MTTETAPLRGNELLRTVVNKIIQAPSCWNQEVWHCGTTHCIGGWCQILGGEKADDTTAREDAKRFLGIDEADSDWLFSSYRTLPEIHAFAKDRIAGIDPFSAGYNRAGYDRDGYNRAGYDRDGYNRAGYDRAGYNRAGYDRDGYDRDGYNRDGYNRAGYDRAGYDRDGYDRDGKPLPLLEAPTDITVQPAAGGGGS